MQWQKQLMLVTQTEPGIEPTVLFVDRQEISKGKIKVTDNI